MILVPNGAAFLNESHAAAYAQRNYRKNQHSIAKRAKGIEKAFQKRKRAFKLNDIGLQKDYTQSAVNKLCLLLDKGKPCISCGRPDDGQARKRNASHYKSRGANSALRFDLRNLHAACVVCNLYQSGNIAGYKQGLLARWGQEILGYLDNAGRLREWTAGELITMRKEFNAEIRRLEKGLPPSKDWRSLNETYKMRGSPALTGDPLITDILEVCQ